MVESARDLVAVLLGRGPALRGSGYQPGQATPRASRPHGSRPSGRGHEAVKVCAADERSPSEHGRLSDELHCTGQALLSESILAVRFAALSVSWDAPGLPL